jgi:hypothetical protein
MTARDLHDDRGRHGRHGRARIVSASRIVERRWAITKLVRPFMSFA